jgi:hypothetical protein
MLTRLRRQLAGAGEVLTDAIRYVAIMIGPLMLLGYVARIAVGAS